MKFLLTVLGACQTMVSTSRMLLLKCGARWRRRCSSSSSIFQVAGDTCLLGPIDSQSVSQSVRQTDTTPTILSIIVLAAQCKKERGRERKRERVRERERESRIQVCRGGNRHRGRREGWQERAERGWGGAGGQGGDKLLTRKMALHACFKSALVTRVWRSSCCLSERGEVKRITENGGAGRERRGKGGSRGRERERERERESERRVACARFLVFFSSPPSPLTLSVSPKP